MNQNSINQRWSCLCCECSLTLTDGATGRNKLEPEQLLCPHCSSVFTVSPDSLQLPQVSSIQCPSSVKKYSIIVKTASDIHQAVWRFTTTADVAQETLFILIPFTFFSPRTNTQNPWQSSFRMSLPKLSDRLYCWVLHHRERKCFRSDVHQKTSQTLTACTDTDTFPHWQWLTSLLQTADVFNQQFVHEVWTVWNSAGGLHRYTGSRYRLRWTKVTTAGELDRNSSIVWLGGCFWWYTDRLCPLMYNGTDYWQCTNNQKTHNFARRSKGKDLTSKLFLLL